MQRSILTALGTSLLTAGLLLSGCGTTPLMTAPPAAPMAQSQAASERGLDEGINYAAIDLLGMTATEAKNLSLQGIHTAGDMLRLGAKAMDRQRISSLTGVSTKRLLTFVNYADLMRMTGVGPRYSFLLEASGVDTVKELAQRNPALLYKSVKLANLRNLVTKLPSTTQIETWVKNAQTMPRVVEY